MMQNMMSGMAASMFIWIALITLICLLVIGLLAWLTARLMNKQKTPVTQSEPQPRDAYEEYEQGYRAQERPLETYQEAEQRYAYPLNEQENTQYQEMEQLQK
jgi:flagellar basal body-associated protein FliL